MTGSQQKDTSRWLDQYEGDLSSIALLLFLYTLQGVPMGLAASVPLLLQEKSISYKEQALFSLVSWPFSLKLLWAPLVDTLYHSQFGRRKSWLVPTQLGIGILFLILGWLLPSLMGEGPKSHPPDVWSLTILFGLLYTLAATQDIAVDGWALTMLSRKNVGMTSTCNTIGQTAGYMLGYVVFLTLNSEHFCNRWLRFEAEQGGIVSLPGFVALWGYVFIISTLLLAVLKSEGNHLSHDEDGLSIWEAYAQMWQLCKLRPFVIFISLLLTCRIGFAAADSITTLKLVEKGLPKESLGELAVMITPLTILATGFISRYTSGARPLTVFIWGYPVRLVTGLVFVALISWAPVGSQSIGFGFFSLVLIATAIHQLASTFMFVAVISFFARISDPAIGGTSMTLLNTVTNLGVKWPQTLALVTVDYVALRGCYNPSGHYIMNCMSDAAAAACDKIGGECHTYVDGFTVLSIICVIIGTGWLVVFGQQLVALQHLGEGEWDLRRLKRRTV